MKIGDKVAYSKKFLQSISEYSGDMPHGRGVITKIIPLGETKLAEIDWNLDLPRKVNTANLVLVSKIPYEA